MIENFFRRPAIDRNAGRALVQSDGATRERAGSAIVRIEIELLLAQKRLYFFDVATGKLLSLPKALRKRDHRQCDPPGFLQTAHKIRSVVLSKAWKFSSARKPGLNTCRKKKPA